MTSTLDAAFHHAGHAVAAHLSKFHALALPVRIDAFGTGEVTAALSRRKLAAADKPATVASRVDPEVAASIAMILCAGLASEEIAAARGVAVVPDAKRSTGDLDMARAELQQARLGSHTQPYQDAAADLLERHWTYVQRIAERLTTVDEMHPHEIHGLMEGAADLTKDQPPL